MFRFYTRALVPDVFMEAFAWLRSSFASSRYFFASSWIFCPCTMSCSLHVLSTLVLIILLDIAVFLLYKRTKTSLSVDFLTASTSSTCASSAALVASLTRSIIIFRFCSSRSSNFWLISSTSLMNSTGTSIVRPFCLFDGRSDCPCGTLGTRGSRRHGGHVVSASSWFNIKTMLYYLIIMHISYNLYFNFL